MQTKEEFIGRHFGIMRIVKVIKINSSNASNKICLLLISNSSWLPHQLQIDQKKPEFEMILFSGWLPGTHFRKQFTKIWTKLFKNIELFFAFNCRC